jgi:hypothetical protein
MRPPYGDYNDNILTIAASRNQSSTYHLLSHLPSRLCLTLSIISRMSDFLTDYMPLDLTYFPKGHVGPRHR